MVWDIQQTTIEREELLAQYLIDAAQTNGTWEPQQGVLLGEAARSVAVYAGAKAAKGMRSETLWADYCRALRAVGASEVAERLLDAQVERATLRHTLLALLKAGVAAPEIWQLALAGVIRHARDWVSTPTGELWIMDTRWLFLEGMDLTRLLALRQTVEPLASVWDAASGKGTLGLRLNPPPVSGRRRNHRDPSARLEEGPCVVRALLEKVKERRGWDHVPAVVTLPA